VKRDIRSMTMPELEAQFKDWQQPAYRVSQGELRTFQWRLNDCFRQQRFPDLVFASEASIALTTYLAGRANGASYNGPAIKR
jgi:sulfur-oxidizing protein SoxA